MLKNKHDALFQRISPNIDTTSPPNQSPLSSISPLWPAFATLNQSNSEFGVDDISPEHTLSKSCRYKTRRGVSVPTLDISLLADQNAELLSKLEKLESEATSADAAGRRELRRLEKEISLLKEEMEKTQARSDELEEKAKSGFGLGAEKMVEEAWKRKQEREARIKSLKNLRSHNQGCEAQNFAPDAPSLFRPQTKMVFPVVEEVTSLVDNAADVLDSKSSIMQAQDGQLVVKLLQKIQELEATNSKILQHQTETTSRLQAVQRETEFMAKIYERLNELKAQHSHDEFTAKDQVSDGFVHWPTESHNTPQSHLTAGVKRSRSLHKHETQSRRRAVGLIGDSVSEVSASRKPRFSLPVPFSEGSLSRRRHHSSYSIGSGGLASPALSSLSLSSPPARSLEEFSDLNLAKELGEQWDEPGDTGQPLPRSLSDLGLNFESQSPCPPPSVTPPPELSNSLQLAIEPPTPQKGAPIAHPHESLLIGNMSPRFQQSRSLRNHNYIYREGRYTESLAPNLNLRKRFAGAGSLSIPSRGSAGPLFFEGFQVIMDEFDERNGSTQQESRDADVLHSPSSDPEDYADAKEELDEATTDVGFGQQAGGIKREEEEIYNEENLSPARSQTSEISKSTVGGIMLEVWMWLQFAIIMLVFLWAMARKGPKSVLRDAERKRTMSMKKSI